LKVRVKVKDRHGNDVTRKVEVKAPIGGNSSGQNNRDVKDAINHLDGENFEASIDGDYLVISPSEDTAEGLAGEPSYYIEPGLNKLDRQLLDLLLGQAMIPADLRDREIGYGRLEWLEGTAAGGGSVQVSVGSFVASVVTEAGMTASPLLAGLRDQLASASIESRLDSRSLTVFSFDEIGMTYSDFGFDLAGELGSASVPEPAMLVLFGAGLLVWAAHARRVGKNVSA
jgi:hypothetical protein